MIKKCIVCECEFEGGINKLICGDICRKKRQLLIQQKLRKKNKNEYTKKYEKTKRGFLMRSYRNIKSRITGVQKKKYHLYEGKEFNIDKKDFYEWSLNNHTFNSLFKEWENKNYDRRLTPSVDRIRSDLGYTFENIRWVTHSENSRHIKKNLSILETMEF